jgi:hypothetical protein
MKGFGPEMTEILTIVAYVQPGSIASAKTEVKNRGVDGE